MLRSSILLSVSLAVGGCGAASLQSVGRTTLNTAAAGVFAVDEVVADISEKEREKALNSSMSMEEYAAKVKPYDVAVDALVATKDSIGVLYSALRTGDEGLTANGLACLGVSVTRLMDALVKIHVVVPTVLRKIPEAINAYGLVCR